jgi:hypothetical protein
MKAQGEVTEKEKLSASRQYTSYSRCNYRRLLRWTFEPSLVEESELDNQKDLEIMMEAISMTIVIHEREEAFFRRSALSSTNQPVKSLFLEIADEMSGHIVSLTSKRQKLTNDLLKLQQRAE